MMLRTIQAAEVGFPPPPRAMVPQSSFQSLYPAIKAPMKNRTWVNELTRGAKTYLLLESSPEACRRRIRRFCDGERCRFADGSRKVAARNNLRVFVPFDV